MKNFLTILLFCLAVYISSAQSCDMEIPEIVGHLDYRLDVIDSLTYANFKSHSNIYERQELKVWSEEELVETYPDILRKKNGCYTVSDGIEQMLFGCPWDSTMDVKDWETYEFEGVYCNQVLIRRQGYEWHDYLSVDLMDGRVFRVFGEPITFNCEFVLAYGYIYTEFGVSLTNLHSKKQLRLETEEWIVKESKQTSDEFYFVLMSTYGSCAMKRKYIRIVLV